ncbi:MAG: ATP-binding protein [Ignavibacteriaceae bacterium]
MAIERNINLILSNKLFSDCNDKVYTYNLSNRNFTDYREGDVIFQAGDTSNFIYLVISGKVKLKLKNINRVLVKSKDEFFGDDEITIGSTRFSSAVALNDCVLYRIDKDAFKKLLSTESQILINIESSKRLEIKDTEEIRPKADFPSVLKLDSSPIKLDIFKRNRKKEPEKEEAKENRPAEKIDPQNELKNNIKDSIEQIKDTPELPDLDSVIEETKSKLPGDNSLKKELLGDAEDADNWNFSTLEDPVEEMEEKIQFEEPILKPDEKIIERKLEEKHSVELRELSRSLTEKYTSYINSVSKLLPGITTSETYEKIMSAFTRHFDANFSVLYILNEKTTTLELIYPKPDNPVAVAFDDGLTGKAAAKKRIIVVRNPERDFRFKPAFDKPKGFSEGSVAYVPLNDLENKLMGVIQLAKTMKDFTKENEEAMGIMAKQAGIVLRHSIINDEKFRQEKLMAFGSISQFLMQDIKSPILTIKHYSNLISKIDIPDQIKKVLTMLSMQANSVIDIMQSTFDFSENKSSVKMQKIEFNETMVNILELLSEYTESKNVKLFKKFGSDVKVNIDARKFYVVCFQVIKNACEAMPTGGKVFVNTESDGSNLVLKIRDEGSGISSNIKDNIFTAFYSSGKENAAGLGLSIAKHIIELMNGSIRVESKINEGTTIIITLPAVED